MGECLTLFKLSHVVAFQALDAFGCRVLHALEDDQTIARGFDAVVEDAELRADPEVYPSAKPLLSIPK